MSWPTELWDQFDTISHHTAKGIEFLDKIGHFVKDRCLIESDYATKLRKLSKSYELKKKSDDREFSYCDAFSQVLREVADMAGQHEVIAENLSAQIVKEVTFISKELKEERKRHLVEGVKYQNLLTNSLNSLDKSKKAYDKAFKESEKAQENYHKADLDQHLSRAEVSRVKTISLTKERACEDSKTDYAKQLQVANEAQREHYTQSMPKVFQQLQDLENRRIECTRNFLKLSAIIQKNVSPIVNKCLDGMIDSANSIDPKADAKLVVDRYKSGMQPPDDIPFEDLSSKSTNCETESTQSKGSSLVYTHSIKSDSLRHTLTGRGLRRRTRLFGMFRGNKNDNYSDLPPIQRRKKIQLKIDSINNQINQAKKAKDGLINMRQAYEETRSFGDPKDIETDLRENEITLQRLNADLTKYLCILEEIDASMSAVTHDPSLENESNKSPSISNSNHRTSIGQDSEISRTNSENSLRPDSNNRDATKSSATNITSNSFYDSASDSNSNNAINTGLDATDGDQSKPENGDSQSNNHNPAGQENHVDGYQTATELPAQAFAKALYVFKAEPAGSISMVANEPFDVIEFDQGDGWTRVRRKVFSPEDEDFIGFVPTSYISIETSGGATS